MLLASSCPVCGRIGPAPCASCWHQLHPGPPAPPPPGVSRCRSLLLYDGAGRELVARIKYRNARSPLVWLGASMAGLVAPAEIDVVTWVPTTVDRIRGRGFDHAELLARRVARRLARPRVALLSRRPGPPQTGRDRTGRKQGPSFTAGGSAAGKRVLLVDDVVTTGATLSAAAGALHRAGALDVLAVTAARTPLRIAAPAPR